MPNWKKFTLVGGRGVYEKRVSLSNRGVMTLNQPAFDELGQPDKVEMLYDEDEQLIGLKSAEPGDEAAVKVRKQGNNKSYLINARPFGYHHKILPPNTVRFHNITVGEDGVMVLDLKNAVDVELNRARPAARDLQEGRNSGVDE